MVRWEKIRSWISSGKSRIGIGAEGGRGMMQPGLLQFGAPQSEGGGREGLLEVRVDRRRRLEVTADFALSNWLIIVTCLCVLSDLFVRYCIASSDIGLRKRYNGGNSNSRLLVFMARGLKPTSVRPKHKCGVCGW